MQRPDRIQIVLFNKAEVISEYTFSDQLSIMEQAGKSYNFPNVMAAITASFKREPNYVCYPKDVYLNLATWMQAVENYIVDAESNFDAADDAYNRSINKEPRNDQE